LALSRSDNFSRGGAEQARLRDEAAASQGEQEAEACQ